MGLLANSNAIETGGYNIQRSLRFRSSASAYLSRTPAIAGNQKKFTWSGWVKRGTLGSGGTLFSAYGGTVDRDVYLAFGSSSGTGTIDTVNFFSPPVAGNFNVYSNAVYRDCSAFYNIVLSVDTTQATASNRVRLYVNGAEISYSGSSSYPTASQTLAINDTQRHTIGENGSLSSWGYFDGYLAEVNFIDGQALTPSSFGATDPVTGAWQPKKYTGTYGTNGFYLPFTDNTSATTLAYDKSGNGNNWTPNNISTTAGATYDSMTDVPTLTSATAANFAVAPPTAISGNSNVSISDGNLKITLGNTNQWRAAIASSISMSSVKFYWEATVLATVSGGTQIGIVNDDFFGYTGDFIISNAAYGCGYGSDGNIAKAGSVITSGATYTTNDVIGVAFDATNGSIQFYKNGTAQGTSVSINMAKSYVATVGGAQLNACSVAFNFGQRPFAYTPPTGFKALNTFNLPDPTIKKGNKYMDATLYTGNGGSLTVTNSGFQPDLIWAKSRSLANWHGLWDSVRGSNNLLYTNATDAENDADNLNITVNATGWSMNGVNSSFNANGSTQVGWQWKAGGTAVTNTAGSITSRVSAGATQGFSVVTYTSPNNVADQTVGHGLGVAPAMIIVKNRVSAYNWDIYHKSLGYNASLIFTTAATRSGAFGATINSSVFTTKNTYTHNGTDTYVAYCFAEIPGFSKFGSYTGNGSADGPFVFTNFQPRYILIKRTDTTGNWYVWDTARNTYNVVSAELYPNLSNAEATNADLDANANGFKIRNTTADFNANGGTYIYAAFATSPFKFSNGR